MNYPKSRNDQVTRQRYLLPAQERTGGVNIKKLAIFLPVDYACHIRTDEIIALFWRDKNFDRFMEYRKSIYAYLA